MGCKKKILQVIADGLSYGLFMSTFLPRRSGFHHGGRFSRLHSVISRSNQHVYSTHYTSSCTPHVSIISREPYVIKLCHDRLWSDWANPKLMWLQNSRKLQNYETFDRFKNKPKTKSRFPSGFFENFGIEFKNQQPNFA